MTEFNGLLNWGPISKVRRNHGLEHATLHLLSRELPQRAFAGHSDTGGFWLIGDVSTDKLLEIVNLALQHMRAGESRLAVHQNCGTNFVTTGVIAGSLAWLTTLGRDNSFKKKLGRWPLMVMVVTGAIIAARPLGLKVQARISTSGIPGNLVVRQITRYQRGGPVMHRISTSDELPTREI